MLPREFPPRSTVQRYFYAWREDGTWRWINYELLMRARLADGREARLYTHKSRNRYKFNELRENRGKAGEFENLIDFNGLVSL